jgi:hypothetical protein
MTDKNPSLDERLEALTHSLELMQMEQQRLAETHKRLEERERQGRRALLTGVAAYLQTLNDEDQEARE